MELVESQGFVIEDMYALDMTSEDLLGFFEILIEMPDQDEQDSYNGLCVVMSLSHPSFESLSGFNPFARRVASKFAMDPHGELATYWFGRA